MAQQQLQRIENATAALMNFPADKTAGIPALDLIPGGKDVSAAVIKALETGKAANGKPVKRGILRSWRNHRQSGRIVVHPPEVSAALVGKPEGPEAPASLREFHPKAAGAIVATTADVALLTVWAQAETRAGMREVIEARLAELGAATGASGA